LLIGLPSPREDHHEPERRAARQRHAHPEEAMLEEVVHRAVLHVARGSALRDAALVEHALGGLPRERWAPPRARVAR
jgi:hypothetical protein